LEKILWKVTNEIKKGEGGGNLKKETGREGGRKKKKKKGKNLHLGWRPNIKNIGLVGFGVGPQKKHQKWVGNKQMRRGCGKKPKGKEKQKGKQADTGAGKPNVKRF